MLKIEREVSFNLSSFISDIGVIADHLEKRVTVEKFAAQLSHCFLPKAVYQIEEYGLPRVTTRRIWKDRLLNEPDLSGDLEKLILKLKSIPMSRLRRVAGIRDVEIYMLQKLFIGTSHKSEVGWSDYI